jgi:transcription-repair coupling factor (superfamily II helicase)
MMRDFEQGAFDILLCTTIIQSGVDIPNVNTILIDRADRFGVAVLFQLRGRVGRSSRKGYAYLLLPPRERMVDESRKRIQAILQHTGLGSGFRLALRDLEIRGAGNLLGHEQSGHIAAVGFDLYCQLLKRTVAQMAASAAGGGTPPPPIVNVELRLDFISLSSNTSGEESACLPHDYVEDERQRLGIYRKIAGAATPEDTASLRTEFKDRFGPIPVPLEMLLTIAEIRILAASRQINSIETSEGKIMLKRGDDFVMPHHRFPRFRSGRPGERLAELKALLETLGTSDSSDSS